MSNSARYPLILTIAYKFVPVIYPVVVLYWKLTRPKTTGVKMILRRSEEILLVINTYGSRRWSLPGGGVLRGESLDEAARRETFEEVGIRVGKIRRHGSFYYTGMGKRDTIWVYSAEVRDRRYQLQSEEIAQAAWFKLNHLPNVTSIVLSKSLELANLI